MDNRRIAGIITAVIAIVGFIVMLNSGMDTPIVIWPLEAYLGVAFTIGWLTSVPTVLAYLLSALVFILIAIVFYKFGSWLYGLVSKSSK